MRIEYFLTDSYKVLKCLCENEVVLMGNKVIPMTQDQIAKTTKLSKTKVHGIIQDLIKKKFVKMESQGRYLVYKEGKDIFCYINKLFKEKK